MRVITGSARGRKLQTLPGTDVVRPTSDKVKESMFSIIQFELSNAVVLDAFAGSGQLGIEAISRGAQKAYFLDRSKDASRVIQENLQSVGFTEQATCLTTDALSFLRSTHEKFDIVFLDPPYHAGLLEETLELVSGALNDSAWVLCETDQRQMLPEEMHFLKKYREYTYSKTKLTVYRNIEAIL